MSLFLKEKDKVRLHYSPDTTDIDTIEFELHNAFVSAIEAYDLKYLSVEYDDENIISAVFYLKVELLAMILIFKNQKTIM